MSLIEPRTLKGFRDYLPEAQIPREWLVDTARRVYRSYGFLPIDTPALEYEEILTGKGGEESDKQMYRFEDHGGRRVALRFDLTVPLARFVAQHQNELGMPFKRYHVASVWRGENTQRGRYREFMQCDFDTIGTESIAADVEMVLVVHDLMRAIGIEDFTIRVNNRRLLAGVLERLELQGRSAAVLRALDKLDKVGPEKVAEELGRTAGARPEQCRRLLAFTALTGSGSGLLEELRAFCDPSEPGARGLSELAQILDGARAAGLREGVVQVDVAIARGLDYYTGTVLETILGELPGIGSVCSGGRYDDLANLYTKSRLPGIGASLGLDRLLSALEELGRLPATRATAPVFVPFFDEARLTDYVAFCAALRRAGFGVELYPDAKKLKAQLQYADRRGFRHAIVIGSDEWQAGTCQVKDLKSGESAVVARSDATGAPAAELLARLGG